MSNPEVYSLESRMRILRRKERIEEELKQKEKMKSFIKDKEFYKDAEKLQNGWGKRLRNIDTLKDKIQYKKPMTLNEYCYSLYGDMYCSHCWGAFKMYCEKELKYGKKKLIYDAWKGIFVEWINTKYDRNKKYE